MYSFAEYDLESIFKCRSFVKILTGTKLYAYIYFDRKHFVFMKS